MEEKMELVYYRKDKESGKEEKMTKNQLWWKLCEVYREDTIIPMLEEGLILQTNFATYRAEIF